MNHPALHVQFLLWPDPILVRPREITHEATPPGQKALAWYRVGDEEAWRDRPIAQNSYPTETAIRLLQGAALAEETMRHQGGPKAGYIAMRYWRSSEEPPRPADVLRADLFAGIDVADPAHAELAAVLRLTVLHFGADPEDEEDGPISIALYPLLLGEVVRLPQDRQFPPSEWAMEYIDLLHSVLAGEGEDYRDRILKHATGGI